MSDKNADEFMMIEGLPESVGIKEIVKLVNVVEKEVWNRAIEAAILIMDNNTDKNNLRSLKK